MTALLEKSEKEDAFPSEGVRLHRKQFSKGTGSFYVVSYILKSPTA